MKIFFTIFLLSFTTALWAQKVDSMYVHLYTDSLKKGTYNYINVDGKLSNGRYIPLDTSEVIFIASDGKFVGNTLWIGPDFKKEKVTIKVILRADKNQCKSFDMYVKKAADPELKSEQEILDDMQSRGKRKRGRSI